MVATSPRVVRSNPELFAPAASSAREIEAIRWDFGVSRYFLAKALGQKYPQNMSRWTRGRRSMSAKYAIRLMHLYRQWKNDVIDLALFDPETYWDEVGL